MTDRKHTDLKITELEDKEGLERMATNIMFVYVGFVLLIDLTALLRLIKDIPTWAHITITLCLSFVVFVVYVCHLKVSLKAGSLDKNIMRKVVTHHNATV